MGTSRLEKIEAMLADDPGDQFLRYSRAMELSKLDRGDESLVLLKELIEQEKHVPACFMTGQQLAARGAVEDARAVLRDGIEMAREQNNSHAAGEMSEFLTSLGTAGA